MTKKEKLRTKTYTFISKFISTLKKISSIHTQTFISHNNKKIYSMVILINSYLLNLMEAYLMATDNRKCPSDFDGILR